MTKDIFISNKNKQQGSVIVSILVTTLFLSVIISSLIVLANANLTRARSRIFLLQSQYAAESGADAAIAELNNGNELYEGSPSQVTVLSGTQYRATYTVEVTPGAHNKQKIIKAVGRVFAPASATTTQFERTIEVLAERSSLTSTTSMISRNIIEASSSVKTVKARDIYLNGYIKLNKLTTDLIAENITVAGKNTGATNCSIGGTGELVKPDSFSNPAQTKTKLTLAFNNCLNPGNVSNANFDVQANIGNISKIQSTLVPVNQFMDASYSAAPGG